jgi:CheY-like chemotaxis protein
MAKTILLADDSITIQKIVNLTFSGEGIDVVTVGNGDAAIKKVYDIHPDLVLADIFMPGKNGYEVCEYIKGESDLQRTPVILLVGAFEPFDSNEVVELRRTAFDKFKSKCSSPPSIR